jgi:hypothetical protein
LTALTVPHCVLAAKINGVISSTLAITEDSELTGDVTCTVTGAPCISINALQVTLDLHGFTISGQGNPQTGCSGASTGNEFGILVNAQAGVTVQGPGVVQRFRSSGIVLASSSGTTVHNVTTSTNCASGILINGGGANEIYDNISIRNGNGVSACGGI